MLNLSALRKTHHLFFTSIFLITLVSFLFFLGWLNDSVLIPVAAHHPFWLNVFFVNYTFMGDGVFSVCLVIVLLFFRRKKQGVAFLSGYLITTIIIQAIKNIADPIHGGLFLEDGQYLFFMHGHDVENLNTISAHTAYAFAIATILMFMYKNLQLRLLLFLAAGMIAFSRIYLAQESLSCVLAGALVGELAGFIAFNFAYRLNFKSRFIRLPRVNIHSQILPSGGPA